MMANFVDRLVRLGDGVPRGVDLVYHFCYGDPFHKHIVEPKDTRVMVELANRISGRVARSIELFHMPVPRGRADEAYFAPLRGLNLKQGAELCLGLVHVTDGIAGARRRMAAADRFVRDYYIATECGMGRRDKATIAALLRVHAEAAGADNLRFKTSLMVRRQHERPHAEERGCVRSHHSRAFSEVLPMRGLSRP